MKKRAWTVEGAPATGKRQGEPGSIQAARGEEDARIPPSAAANVTMHETKNERTVIIDSEDYSAVRFPRDIADRITRRKIFLKPNISTKSPCSFTNASFVKALAEFLSDQGFDVVIAEGMHLRKYKETVLRSTGYTSLMKSYEFIDLEEERCRVIEMDGRLLDTIAVPELLFDENATIINVPKLKTHLMTLITGPIKNIAMGIVNQHTKAKMHKLAGDDFDLLCDMMIDVYDALRDLVGLTVIDAVEIMVGNGPSFGRTYKLGRILVGDAVELEWACANVLGLKGYPMTARMEARGIHGREHFARSAARIPLPDTYRKGYRARLHKYCNLEFWGSFIFGNTTIRKDWHKVSIDKELCIECGECISHCPSNAIADDFVIDTGRCNRCLCCVENCPQNAVRIKTSRIMRILDTWGSRFY